MRNIIGPIASGDDFFDREAEIRQLWNDLESNNVLMLGPPRIGKSSIVRRIQEEAVSKGFRAAIYVDVSDCTNEQQLVQQIVKTVMETSEAGVFREELHGTWLGQYVVALPKARGQGSSVVFQHNPGWESLGQEIADLLNRSGGQWLLLIEGLPVFASNFIESSPNADHTNRIRRFLNWLRKLRSAYPHVRWLLTGSFAFNGMLSQLNLSASVNDFHTVSVGAFPETIAQNFLHALGESYRVYLSQELRNRVLERIGLLSPFYLQLAFMLLRQSEPLLTTEEGERAVDSLQETKHKVHFDSLRQQLTPGPMVPKAALQVLDRISLSIHGVTFGGLLQVEPSQIELRDLLYLLRDEGFVFENQGHWQFRSPILRDYWRRQQSLSFENTGMQATAPRGGESWRLTGLHVKNFRCFEELHLDFTNNSILSGDWTCVAGINGAGKSSVLQAVCIALLGHSARELGGGFLRRALRVPQGAEITLTLSGKASPMKRTLWVHVDANGSVEVNENGTIPSVPNGSDSFERPIVIAYGATRNLGEEPELQLRNLSPEVRRVVGLFQSFVEPPGAEILFSARRRSSAIARLFGDLVAEVFQDDLKITIIAERVQFSVLGKDNVDAFGLPDGFRSSVAWLADLCVTWCETHPERADDARPADIDAIVLVDEIDLHLHPSLQRELVPRLRKALPKVQWIVTTHSPLLLSSFDSSEIVALDRNEPSGVRFLDRQIMGFSANEIYEWLMDTPPTSLAMEQKLREAKQDPTKEREAAELLETSPSVNGDQAKQNVGEMLAQLEKLNQ